MQGNGGNPNGSRQRKRNNDNSWIKSNKDSKPKSRSKSKSKSESQDNEHSSSSSPPPPKPKPKKQPAYHPGAFKGLQHVQSSSTSPNTRGPARRNGQWTKPKPKPTRGSIFGGGGGAGKRSQDEGGFGAFVSSWQRRKDEETGSVTGLNDRMKFAQNAEMDDTGTKVNVKERISAFNQGTAFRKKSDEKDTEKRQQQNLTATEKENENKSGKKKEEAGNFSSSFSAGTGSSVGKKEDVGQKKPPRRRLSVLPASGAKEVLSTSKKVSSDRKQLEKQGEEGDDDDKEEKDDDEDFFVKERPKQSTYERRNIVRPQPPGSAYAPYTPPGEAGMGSRTKSGRLGYSQVSMGRRGVASYRGETGEAPVRNSLKLKDGFASAMAEAERFAGELGSKFQRSINRRSNRTMGEKSVEDVDFVPYKARERKRWWPFNTSSKAKKEKKYARSESDEDIQIDEEVGNQTKANIRETRSKPPPKPALKTSPKEDSAGFPLMVGAAGLFAGAAAMFQSNSPPEKPPKPVYILSRTTVDPPMKPKRPAKIIARDMEDVTQPLSLLKWSIAARNLGVIAGFLYLYVVPFAFIWDFSVNQGQRPENEREVLLVDVSIPYIAFILGVGLLFWEQWSGHIVFPEKSTALVAAHTLLSIPGFFSNVALLPGLTCLLAAVSHLMSLIRMERGTIPSKAMRCYSWKELRKMCSCVNIRNLKSYEGLVLALYLTINAGLWIWWFLVLYSEIYLPCIEFNIEDLNCVTFWVTVAKGFGMMLNFNCALLFLPLCRVVLARLSRASDSPGSSAKRFRQRLYEQSVNFHKLVAYVCVFAAFVHVSFHYINVGQRATLTLGTYGDSAFLTGVPLTLTFIIILMGREKQLRRLHYSMFWKTHYMFIPFVLLLLAHSPRFWCFAVISLPVFAYEKRLRSLVRAKQRFYVRDVEYIHPVISLKFRPERDEDFKFLEGQYLLLMVPSVSEYEWHPFSMSSAQGDLAKDEDGFIQLNMRVTGTGRWTYRVRDYFKELAGQMDYLRYKDGSYIRDPQGRMIPDPDIDEDDFVSSHLAVGQKSFKSGFHHVDSTGVYREGMLVGPDGNRLIVIDGPYQSPSQGYSDYDDVLLVGSGIGLTPVASILRAVLQYKWKKGHPPNSLRFYWVLSQREVHSYRWFIRLLAELVGSVVFDRESGALRDHQYIEMNIYVTRVQKLDGNTRKRSMAQPRPMNLTGVEEKRLHTTRMLRFDAQTVYDLMLEPEVDSIAQTELQSYGAGGWDKPTNGRFECLWIWKGRPNWQPIFEEVRRSVWNTSPGNKHVGVAFCGNPMISNELKKLCKANTRDGVQFSLHSETFG